MQDEVDALPTKAYVDWKDNLKANVTDVYDKDTMDQLLADKAHVTHTHTTAEVTWLATQLATHTADIAALDTRVDALESDMADVKDDIQTAGGVILDTIRIAGFGISIIMLVAFGIKYMTTMPAERAQMMKQSMVYLLGAVFIFGASFIVGIVVNVVEKATQF